MNRISLSIAVIGLMLSTIACSDSNSSETKNAKAGETAQAKAAIKADVFLNPVPEETTYFINFDTKTLPAKSVKLIKDSIKTNADLRKEVTKATSSTRPSQRFTAMAAKSLMDNFVANTLGGMGLADRPRLAVYGLGLWPVAMVDLKDHTAFEKWLSGMETTAKISTKTETFEGVTYRLYPIENEVATILVISKGKATFALVPTELKAQILPYLIGKLEWV